MFYSSEEIVDHLAENFAHKQETRRAEGKKKKHIIKGFMSQHAISFSPNNKIQMQEELCSCETCLVCLILAFTLLCYRHVVHVEVYLRTHQ